MPRFLKIAHRGASGSFPENTRLAFRKAIEARVDMIEMDCQLSKDGHIVVFHDEKLSRIAKARGKVGQTSLEQLKKLDIGRWRDKGFRGERIQTLEEVLSVIDGDARLCIDIKQYPGSPAGIELKLLFILSHFDCLEHVILSSFDHRCLWRIRELAPQARIGLIYGKGAMEDPFTVTAGLGAFSIHVQKELASREIIHRAWDEGLDVIVWTVNDTREIEKFASLGVQGIMSDFPVRFWQERTHATRPTWAG
ncbi:MAG: glycerophosphodiester phosphodiesterase family protein [Deltaproteobacteria bacterium]|nr:glycerophosphodiester phosphodiesterase family protein [Deltaproteobacteria bacterium]